MIHNGKETSLDLREKHEQAIFDARKIAQRAKDEKRELTDAEIIDTDDLISQAEMLQTEIRITEVEEQAPSSRGSGRQTTANQVGSGFDLEHDPNRQASRQATVPKRYTNAKNDKTVRVLGKGDRFVDLPPSPDFAGLNTDGISLGRYIVASVTGRFRDSREKSLVMGGIISSAGGAAVPEPLAREFIDNVRAQSVMFRAGMSVIPMDALTLDIARVTGDPSFSVFAESATIGATDLTLDRLQFTAKKFGQVVKASRELIEDAPNASSMIEGALAKAWAAELDRLILQGDGGASDGIFGLQNSTDVSEDLAIGAISWEEIVTGLKTLRLANFDATSIIMDPETEEDLAILTANDEANAFSPAPLILKDLPQFSTPNCASSDLFIGDFAQVLLGLRQDVSIEISDSADTAFADHQIWIKLTTRIDLQLQHQNAVHRLVGITHA